MNLCKKMDKMFLLFRNYDKAILDPPQKGSHFQHFPGDMRESEHNLSTSANQTLSFIAVTSHLERICLLKIMQLLMCSVTVSLKNSSVTVSCQENILPENTLTAPSVHLHLSLWNSSFKRGTQNCPSYRAIKPNVCWLWKKYRNEVLTFLLTSKYFQVALLVQSVRCKCKTRMVM